MELSKPDDDHSLAPFSKAGRVFHVGTYLFLAAIWIVFLQSALVQTDRSWQIWLISARAFMLLLSFVLAGFAFLRHATGLLPWYFAAGMLVQASFAFLEPEKSTDFYKYVGYFLLLQ